MTPSKQIATVRERLNSSLDHYRTYLHDSLDDLSEEEARRSLVPSRTTLLGLVKHVTYVETFYFVHCVTGQPLKELGVASTPDRSFVLTKRDDVESIREAHRAACARSRESMKGRPLDEVVTGRGEQDVLTITTRALFDFIHHCGHADILREQVLAARG